MTSARRSRAKQADALRSTRWTHQQTSASRIILYASTMHVLVKARGA